MQTNQDSLRVYGVQSKKRSGIIWWLFLILIIVGGFFYWWLQQPKCQLPVKYAIGNIDERFKISKTDLEKTLLDSEKRWDLQIGINTLEYDPNATLKINLVYDERQAGFDELKSKIDNINQSDESLSNLNDKLKLLVTNYEQDLANYNEEVEYWNARGGAPADIYNKLQSTQASLEDRRLEINKFSKSLNVEVNEYNSNLQSVKDEIEVSKNKIYTQGLFIPDNNEINIYTFNNTDELRLVMMHELGHAIGILDHAQNPQSIMYPITDSVNGPDLVNPTLTPEDIKMLQSVCNL